MENTLSDKIDQYLDGKMRPEENAAFEKELQVNEHLRQQVEMQKDLRQGIERINMKSSINSQFRKMSLKSKLYKWGIATVAITAIATATYFGYNSINQNNSANNYSLPQLNEEGKAEWADADKNLPTQTFSINPDKDTVLETAGGIVFAIPAGAFQDAKDPITLEVREALTPMDIMKAGLSTTSDGKLLETGGMFYLNARNDAGQSLKINPAKPVYANVPTNEIKPDILLFSGERKSDGSINWTNPKPLEKQLVPVDINTLDFYPKGFRAKVAELGFDANNKRVTDSIYYSYAGRAQWQKDMWTTNAKEEIIVLDSFNYTLEINPARISAIWNNKFQNTLIATKEFEERLQVIFKSAHPELLDLYVNNLDKKMYQIDSLASLIYVTDAGPRPEFHNFYLRHDGGIAIDQPHMKELQNYFNLKRKAVQMASEKTYNDRKLKEQKEDNTYNDAKTNQAESDSKRKSENFTREYEVNLNEAYRQLGLKRDTSKQVNAKATYYGFTVTNIGWCNVDRYVFEATSTRTTLDYTDPNSGKKAVIKYEPLTISVNNENEFEQIQVYLVPDSLNSFMKVKKEGATFKENLNELFRYSLVVVAQKGNKWFWMQHNNVKSGNETVQLDEIAESQLRVNLDNSFTKTAGEDFRTELDMMIEQHTYNIQLKARQKQEEIDKAIMPVIFPFYVPYDEPATPQYDKAAK